MNNIYLTPIQSQILTILRLQSNNINPFVRNIDLYRSIPFYLSERSGTFRHLKNQLHTLIHLKLIMYSDHDKDLTIYDSLSFAITQKGIDFLNSRS